MKRLLSVLLTVLLLLSVLPISAFPVTAAETEEVVTGAQTAKSGSTENCTWTLDTATGTMNIYGTGEMDIPELFFKEDSRIKRIVVNSGITSVSDGAFSRCPQLSEVVLAETVTQIGKSAFYWTSMLKTIDIPGSVKEIGEYAFMRSALSSVTLNEGLEKIGKRAFISDHNLKSIHIPDSVTEIGEYAIGYSDDSEFDASSHNPIWDFSFSGSGEGAVKYARENRALTFYYTGKGYGIWIGSTLVSEYNYDRIFKNRDAQYDPDTATLTLYNRILPDVYTGSDGSTCFIYADSSLPKLTIKGEFNKETPDVNYCILSERELVLDGDFSMQAADAAVYGKGDVTIASGTVSATAGTTGTGIIADGRLLIQDDIVKVTAEGGNRAITAGEIIPEKWVRISIPEGGSISQNPDSPNVQTVCTADGAVAKSVVIDGPDRYDLWLGTTRVEEMNKDDILGDGGKAQYDPETYTLTLHDPEIEGTTVDNNYINQAKILSKVSRLTIKGSYKMTEAETSLGLSAVGTDLTLDGDFAFKGTSYGMSVKSLTVQGGSLYHGGFSYGYPEKLTVCKGVERVEIDGRIWAKEWDIDPSLCITTPEGAYIKNGFIYGYRDESEDAAIDYARHIVIEPRTKYDIWLGSTQVTPDNKNDILGDGKAQYDPETATLTLDDPEIEGVHTGSYGSAKICFKNTALTVKGSYHMTEAQAQKGIYGFRADLTLDGDFTFLGTETGVRSKNLTVESGTLYAEGNSYGIVCLKQFEIGSAVKWVEVKGGEYAIDAAPLWIHSEDSMAFVTPEGGHSGENTVFEADGTTKAKHVIIAKTTWYPLWVGSVQVNELNKDDILRDGGKAKYDPETCTLNLDNPELKYTTFSVTTYKIRFEGEQLTVKGSYIMKEADADYVLSIRGDLILDGDFVLKATRTAIYSKDCIVKGGSLYAEGGKTGISLSSGGLVIGEDVVRVEAYGGGNTGAVFADKRPRINGKQELTVPALGEWKNGRYVESDGETAARHVVFECVSAYDIWLGSTSITPDNKNDILGDGGKAQYDSQTHILTLDNPEIAGVHIGSDASAKIYSESVDLRIKGSYKMAEAQAQYGIYTGEGALTVDGDFAFIGSETGVKCQDLTISRGTLYAEGGSSGIVCNGQFVADWSASRLQAKGGEFAISADSITVKPDFFVRVPKRGQVGEKSIYEDDGETPAKEVLLQYPESYTIWLGSTQVTDRNKDDILGDGGKAQYDPDTCTLTLNDPVIKGVYQQGVFTYKICIKGQNTTTIRGSYSMPEAEAYNGLLAGDTILDGDFVFKGTENGIFQYVSASLTIQSGTLYAEGRNIGMGNPKQLIIGEGVSRVEAKGSEYAMMSLNAPEIDPVFTVTHSYDEETSMKRVVVERSAYQLGDADRSGELEIRDATWIQRYEAKMELPFVLQEKYADVDGDGEITLIDASAIQYYLANLKTNFPIGTVIP